MKTITSKFPLFPAILFLAALSVSRAGIPAIEAVIESPSPTGDGWWFRAAPYGWVTAVDGDVSVGSLTAPVDISLSDILESVDMTFMGVFEVGYDRWSLGVDVVYAKLSQDLDGGGRVFDSFRFEQKQWFVTPALSYRLIDTGSYIMAVYAGARITTMDVDLTGRFARGGETKVSADSSWVDPVVGIRGQADFGDRWFFRYTADIGGFGTSSELTWNAFGGFGYNIGDTIGLIAGYRGLGIDYSQDEFALEVISHGPVIGLEVRF